MVNLKAWRTDIKIKYPRVHWIGSKQYSIAADEFLKFLLKIVFVLGLWKACELPQLLKELLELVKGWV